MNKIRLSKGLSIQQKIMLGFFLLIVMSGVITAFNIYDMRSFHQRFYQHQNINLNTNIILDMNADVSDLQRAIIAFSDTSRESDMGLVFSKYDDVKNHIEKLLLNNVVIDEAAYQNLLKLKQLVLDLREKIDSLQHQRDDRKQIINTELSPLYAQVIEHINALFYSAAVTRNDKKIELLWKMRSDFSPIRTYSALYFENHQARDKKYILEGFEAFINDIKAFRLMNNDPKILGELDLLSETVNKASEVFHRAVQSDRNYMFLINIVIAGETTEIDNVAALLRSQYLNYEKQIFRETELQSARNQNIAIGVSVFGSLIALVMALVMGQRLSAPLVSITNTFSKLARGETLATIPEQHRKDEIGSLAHAADVFRQTNEQTVRYLREAEKYAEELSKREQALEAAAAQAKEASVAKSQFLANMSHELRTPMNAILGMLALLQKTELSTRQEDYIHKTENAARSLLSLLNDILDLSKAEAGKIELDPVPFDLRELIQNLNLILSTSTANKTIELNFSVEESIPRYFHGDSLRLQQILINLGSNAVKFTEKGEVKIEINQVVNEAGRRLLCFSVKDSGIGIANENIVKIFSGFTQAEASTTRRFGGTGLGLAISQRLVVLMGGELRVESELGVGSRFYFTIDLPEPTAAQILELQGQQQHGDHSAKQRLKGINILLVEDNFINQQIAMELLEMEGAQVVCANDGQEAVSILEKRCENSSQVGFDLVLMDLQMPVMDGISATQFIRRQLNLQSLPIIAMTANAMNSDRENCLNAGMNDHVGKPFDIDQLIITLLKYCARGLQLVGNPDSNEAAVLTSEQVEVDLASALGRLGGNKEVYKKMLPQFANTLELLPEQLQTYVVAKDYGATSRLLHTLKGLAGTMGFVYLAELAARGEKLFKSDVEPQQANLQLLELNQQLKKSRQQLTDIEQQV